MFEKFCKSDNSFVIAEVGQNHQGDPELAIEYIRVFANAGANAIKFQTRDNKHLFSEEAYEAPYHSENAFAPTYGKHREALELDTKYLPLLKKECESQGVFFMSTPFDEPSLGILDSLNTDILKVASFDIGNLPFLDKIGKTRRPVVMSIGGGKLEHVIDSVHVIQKYHSDISILHCVSEYPCEYRKLGLENIKRLIQKFPNLAIGLSDHFNGTLSGPIAYTLGARIFEKHVTLNRSNKGTDHSFALEPEGFRKFSRDINRVKDMYKVKDESELGKEYVFQKLGKSIIASQNILEGEAITIDNLSGKIFTHTHIPVRDSNKIIGKKANRNIIAGEPIQFTDLY